jgi:sugar fermentation stimulation protein A
MKILAKIENYEKGIIIERLNRFVVKGKIKNKPILAHLNNTGRLEDFLKKGKIGLFLPIENKLKFRLSMVKESKNIYSIIDTQLQMKCFEIALEKGYISWLKGAKILKRNFRINNSNLPGYKPNIAPGFRTDVSGKHQGNLSGKYQSKISIIDYLIKHKNKNYLLEVKSAVMKYKSFAMYPDCPSIRGQRHIKELIDIQTLQTERRLGGKMFVQTTNNISVDPHIKYPRLSALYPYKSVVLFIAGMKNISAFSPNKNADPKIYELLKIAKEKGVKIKAIQIYFDEKRKSVILENDDLPVIL